MAATTITERHTLTAAELAEETRTWERPDRLDRPGHTPRTRVHTFEYPAEWGQSPIGYRLLIETQPFVNSDRRRVREATFVSQDRHYLWVTTDGRNRFCVPRETIRSLTVEVVRGGQS